jgi:hypothetical protein
MDRTVRVLQSAATTVVLLFLILTYVSPTSPVRTPSARDGGGFDTLIPVETAFLLGSIVVLFATWGGVGVVGSWAVARLGASPSSAPVLGDANPYAAPVDAAPPPASKADDLGVLRRMHRIAGEPIGIAGNDPIAHLTFAAESPSIPIPENREIDADDPHVVVMDHTPRADALPPVREPDGG